MMRLAFALGLALTSGVTGGPSDGQRCQEPSVPALMSEVVLESESVSTVRLFLAPEGRHGILEYEMSAELPSGEVAESCARIEVDARLVLRSYLSVRYSEPLEQSGTLAHAGVLGIKAESGSRKLAEEFAVDLKDLGPFEVHLSLVPSDLEREVESALMEQVWRLEGAAIKGGR